MQLLADESVDMAFVRALRQAGHNVLAVAEDRPGANDEEVAALGRSERRLVRTEDRDFGRLVFALNQPSGGVVYIRYAARAREAFVRQVVEAIAKEGERLLSSFL